MERKHQAFWRKFGDDVCWTIIGTTRWSKTYRGKQVVYAELIEPLFSQFKDQYTNTAHRFIAGDDYVVVEARGRATTKAGKLYDNAYCYVFRIAGEKIQELTEYCDTALITAAFDGQMTA